MAGARGLGEVHSYPSQNESYDDYGYLLDVDGSGHVGKVAGGGTGVFAVNYVSSEDEDGVSFDTLAAGDPLDCIREGYFPLVADAVDFTIGDDAVVSASNAGHVSNTGGGENVGTIVETNDLSGGSDGDEHILVDLDL